MPRRRSSAVPVLLIAVASLAACSTDPSVASAPAGDSSAGPSIEHVHGVVSGDQGSVVYAATHAGVWRVEVDPGTGSPRGTADVVAGRLQDTMGLASTSDGALLASGHPDPAEQPDLTPPVLGLIRSDDGARTWQSVSLRGEVDFHDLEVAGATSSPSSAARVYGVDATSSTLLVSDDTGVTWREGAALEARDVTVDGRDADVVYATTVQGVVVSRDAGATFEPLAPSPPLLLIDAADSGGPWPGLVGVTPTGEVWSTPEAGRPWQQTGQMDADPEALTVVGGPDGRRLVAADGRGVVTSRDAGRTWTVVIASEQP